MVSSVCVKPGNCPFSTSLLFSSLLFPSSRFPRAHTHSFNHRDLQTLNFKQLLRHETICILLSNNVFFLKMEGNSAVDKLLIHEGENFNEDDLNLIYTCCQALRLRDKDTRIVVGLRLCKPNTALPAVAHVLKDPNHVLTKRIRPAAERQFNQLFGRIRGILRDYNRSITDPHKTPPYSTLYSTSTAQPETSQQFTQTSNSASARRQAPKSTYAAAAPAMPVPAPKRSRYNAKHTYTFAAPTCSQNIPGRLSLHIDPSYGATSDYGSPHSWAQYEAWELGAPALSITPSPSPSPSPSPTPDSLRVNLPPPPPVRSPAPTPDSLRFKLPPPPPVRSPAPSPDSLRVNLSLSPSELSASPWWGAEHRQEDEEKARRGRTPKEGCGMKSGDNRRRKASRSPEDDEDDEEWPRRRRRRRRLCDGPT